MAVVEFARHVCGMKGAHSSELDPDTPYPVIDLMEGQRGVTDKGGTMRLGAFPCRIDREDTAAFQAYRTSDISERHRHRYEFNNEYRQRLTQAGLRLSGLSPDGRLVEIVELPSHPWFVGVLCRRPIPPGAEKPAQPGTSAVSGIYIRGEGEKQGIRKRAGRRQLQSGRNRNEHP